jgi:hypothetical protein
LKPKSFLTIVFICLGAIIFFIAYRLIEGMTSPEGQLSVESARIYMPLPTPGNDLQVLETNAGIKIPKNAREIHGMVSGFRDLDSYIRFDLPYADLTSFIQNTLCKELLERIDPMKISPGVADPDWWQPYKAREIQDCSGQEEHLSQHILIDKSKPEKLTIYILAIASS